MPQHQKPQDRAKQKKRQTRRLAAWRAKQEKLAENQPQGGEAKPKS